jgi:co-chaperonin GroES (HSP10)|tara:strand:+ start:4451 stop:4708 length:258 start_codon:yes stop_codon:yes gene_type:complete
MKAVGKYVLVKEVKESHKSQGGLLLTSKDTVGMMYRKGEVVSFGSGLSYLKEGDNIYYNKLQTHEVRINEELFTVVQDKDIVVVL